MWCLCTWKKAYDTVPGKGGLGRAREGGSEGGERVEQGEGGRE